MIIGISGKLNSGKDTVAQIIQYLIARKEDIRDIKIQTAEFLCLNKGNWEAIHNRQDFKIVRFADKLKDCVCLILGCTREQLEDREFKEKKLGEEWWKYELSWHEHAKVDGVYNTYEEACEELKNFGGSSFDEKDAITTIKLTPRLLMQFLGTEAGRQIIHPNIWVNALMSDYKGITATIIDKNCPRQGIYEVTEDDELRYGKIDKLYPNWIIPDVRFKNEADVIKEKDGLLIRVNRPCTTCNKYVNQFCSNPYHVSNHQSEIDLDDYGKFDYVINNDGTVDELILKIKDILIKEHII